MIVWLFAAFEREHGLVCAVAAPSAMGMSGSTGGLVDGSVLRAA
jgi:hypothetical protein